MTLHEILGISPSATEPEIRAAYLEKVKAFPPDRSPEEFEKIRDAYETLRDPRQRFLAQLLDTEFIKPLPQIIVPAQQRRAFVGPQLWLEALKSK